MRRTECSGRDCPVSAGNRPAPALSRIARLDGARDLPIIPAVRPGPTRALPAECTPGPSHNERTGTRRRGCRDVLPEPSVSTFTVKSKHARSTGPTRRWTVPNPREYGPGASPQCARSRAFESSARQLATRRGDRSVSARLDSGGNHRRSAAAAPVADPVASSRCNQTIQDSPIARHGLSKRPTAPAATRSRPTAIQELNGLIIR